MTEPAPETSYDLGAHLADQVAIDNACLALVTVFPETHGRVDVYVPTYVVQRGFDPPGHNPNADRFWVEVAARLIPAEESQLPVVVTWRGQPLRLLANWLSANRWVITWTAPTPPDPQLARLIPVSGEDALLRVDESGILVEANEAYFRLGWGRPEAIGKPLVDTVPPGYAAELRSLLSTVWTENATVQRIVVTRRQPPRWLHVRAHQILLVHGDAGVEINIADVTGSNLTKPEVMAQLMRDHLTGVLNRRAFFNIIDSDRVSRCPFTSVMFVDVQGFKTINDTWGHTVGDETLVEVARMLLHHCGPSDVLARMGGDEFVILVMPDSTVEAAVRAWTGQSVLAGGYRIPISIRAGIARRTDGQPLGDLVPMADHAVTAAKSDPSGRVQEWTPELSRHVEARTTAERSVRAAIDEDRVQVHFQPLVNLDAADVIGFEALLRLTGATGPIPPMTVVETARRLGLADALARRIAVHAMADGKDLLERYPAAVIEVNLSREYLASGTAVDAMMSIAETAGVPAGRLALELTEELTEGIPLAVLRAQVARAQALGIGLMIDDFGRGETSLSILRDLRPSGIKLDRSLVPAADDIEAWQFLEGAVAMLRTLTENLIAEGIEHAWQSRRMHDLGVASQQGWLFGRPHEAAHWLTNDISAHRPE